MGDYTYHDFLAYAGIGGAHPEGMRLTKEVLSKEGLNAAHKVLDAGCGTGRTATYMARNFGCAVTGIDAHSTMIEKANARRGENRHLPLEFCKGNIENLPFDSHSFDVIVAESVTLFTDHLQTLREYERVLKPNGIVLNLDLTASMPLSAQENEAFKRFYGLREIPTQQGWCDLFRQAGFKTIEIIQEGQVSSTLPMEHWFDEEMMDFNPSESMDLDLYDVWEQHIHLMTTYESKLGYCYYRLQKERHLTG